MRNVQYIVIIEVVGPKRLSYVQNFVKIHPQRRQILPLCPRQGDTGSTLQGGVSVKKS